jgi:hypothetical protein
VEGNDSWVTEGLVERGEKGGHTRGGLIDAHRYVEVFAANQIRHPTRLGALVVGVVASLITDREGLELPGGLAGSDGCDHR